MKTKTLVRFIGLLALTLVLSVQPSALLQAAPLGRDALVIEVQGVAGIAIRWVASVRTVEVIH